MSRVQQIARSSAALLISNAANKFTGFLIMVSVARFLGAEQFGLYTFVFSYVWLFGLATDLGLTFVVAREISKDETSGRLWLGNAMAVRGFASMVVYLCCVGTSLLFNGWSSKTGLIALSALTFLFAPLSTSSAIFTARLKLYESSIVNLLSRLVLWMAVQMLARLGASLTTLIIVEVALGSITITILWLWAHRMLRPTYLIERGIIASLIAQGIPLSMTSLFIALYFRMDVFFLEYLRGDADVGSYAAAYRLAEAIPLAAAAFTSSLFPVICQFLHQENDRLLNRLVRGSQKFLLVLVVPVVLALAWHAGSILRLLYAGRFDSSALPLAILSCGQIFVCVNILSSTLLVARNQGRLLMFVTMGMVPLNALLNLVFIPLYGVPGAASTTVLTEIAGMSCLLWLTRTIHGFAAGLVRILPAGATCLLALWVFDRISPGSVLWPIPLALALYGLVVRLINVFDHEEWDRLKKVAF